MTSRPPRPTIAPGLPQVEFGREICGHSETAFAREWLVANGLGGFAAGTLSGARSRRYHGLLVAALDPPVGRTLLVAKLDTTVRYLDRAYALATNEFGDGTIAPRGFELIEGFRTEGSIPAWTYALADARLVQRVWMEHGANTTYLTLELERGSAPLSLEVNPLCAYRDYHNHQRGGLPMRVDLVDGGCRIIAFDSARPYFVLSDRGRFEPRDGWYWNFLHRAERARGLDDREDLFCPGVFRVDLAPGESAAFTLSAEPLDPTATRDIRAALARERDRQRALLAGVASHATDWIGRLVLAADQFVVARGAVDATGTTVIAGYPWFADWGRDTMIALPGLLLATGRFGEAASVLRTFARHVSEGMLPNRFPDSGEAPEYNTVDAALWYIHAVHEHWRLSGDDSLARELYPVLREIVEWHRRGTRYGIRVDPADGLLRAGEPGVQLTWMDAKIGDHVVTPRIGKPVEVNALWHGALCIMAGLASRFAPHEADSFATDAARVAGSFRDAFWHAGSGYLFDVIDGPEGDVVIAGRRCDTRLRPNQILAAALPFGLLDPAQAKAVVDACGRELLVSYGLRSLAPRDPEYCARYAGGPVERDGAYHQGTVWAWLLGPFAVAHYRVYRDAAAAQGLLAPIVHHLDDAAIGSISEIFDGDPPHAPKGCFAQAWSVAEILRAWRALEAEAPSA